MIDTPFDEVQVEGNKEVVEFLEGWLAHAKKGKMNFVGLIGTDPFNGSYTGHCGVIGTEYAANFAIDQMKWSIISSVLERTNRVPKNVNAPASNWCYNLSTSPTSFDFVVWLAEKEMIRVKEGAPGPLRVIFSAGEDMNFAKALTSDQRLQKFNGIVRQAIPLFGAVEDKMIFNNARIRDVFVMRPIVDMYKEGCAIPKVRASDIARAKVRKIIGERRPIVITLRESEYWPQRNSNFSEWMKFATNIRARGYDLVIVRDTEKAALPLEGFQTIPEASVDLDVRLALYEASRACLFCSNGPVSLGFFADYPWMMFAPIDPSGAYDPGKAEWWIKNYGIEAGGQFPWCTQNQRIVWEMDTYDVLVREWDKFEGSLATAA